MAISRRRGFVAVFVIVLSVMLLLPALVTAEENWVVLYREDQWVRPLGNLSTSETTTLTFSILVKEEDIVDVELRDKDDNLLRVRNDVKEATIVWYVEPSDGADRLIVKRIDPDYSTGFTWSLKVFDPSDYVEEEGYVPTWWEENQLAVLAVFGVTGLVALTLATFAGPFTELEPLARLHGGFLRFFNRIPPR